MTLKYYQVAAGLDIHKKFIIAILLLANGTKNQQRFERTVQDSLALKAWILEDKCDVVACESTSDYWVHIYDHLIDHVPVLIGNATISKFSLTRRLTRSTPR